MTATWGGGALTSEEAIEQVRYLLLANLSPATSCKLAAQIARRVPLAHDTPIRLLQIRSFAASAGDTISPTEALAVVRSLVQQWKGATP